MRLGFCQILVEIVCRLSFWLAYDLSDDSDDLVRTPLSATCQREHRLLLCTDYARSQSQSGFTMMHMMEQVYRSRRHLHTLRYPCRPNILTIVARKRRGSLLWKARLLSGLRRQRYGPGSSASSFHISPHNRLDFGTLPEPRSPDTAHHGSSAP